MQVLFVLVPICFLYLILLYFALFYLFKQRSVYVRIIFSFLLLVFPFFDGAVSSLIYDYYCKKECSYNVYYHREGDCYALVGGDCELFDRNVVEVRSYENYKVYFLDDNKFDGYYKIDNIEDKITYLRERVPYDLRFVSVVSDVRFLHVFFRKKEVYDLVDGKLLGDANSIAKLSTTPVFAWVLADKSFAEYSCRSEFCWLERDVLRLAN